jgi:hypothetical protein
MPTTLRDTVITAIIIAVLIAILYALARFLGFAIPREFVYILMAIAMGLLAIWGVKLLWAAKSS